MIDSPSAMARLARLPSDRISRPMIDSAPFPSLALTTRSSLPDGTTTQPSAASTRPRARHATSSRVVAVGSPASRRWVISFIACSLASWRRRSVASRTKAPTKRSPPVENGARLTSIGNTLPSRRRPVSSRPAPIGRARPLSVNFLRWRSCIARACSGTNASMLRPTTSSGSKPNSVLIASLASTISPSASTAMTASGEDCNSVASTSAVSATRDCIGTTPLCSLTGVRA